MVNQPAGGPEDPTAKLPPSAPTEDTTVVPAEDGTMVIDPTAQTIAGAAAGGPPVGGPDATRVQPAAEPRWSARANVPPPGTVPARPVAPEEEAWPAEDPYAGRSWLTPVIVGIVLLVLAAVLAFGVWLIYRAVVERQGGEPAVPPAATSSEPSPSLESPSSSPSVESPSPSPTPSIVEVTIPALRGDPVAEATAQLTALGLKVRVTEREDTSLPPGRVLDTRPSAGSTVQVGETVTLIVAKAPAPSPSRSSRSPSPAASDGDA